MRKMMNDDKTSELRRLLAGAEVDAPFTDDPEFLASVERGYLECEASLAEEVQNDDTFFQDILEGIRKNPASVHPGTDWGPPTGKEK